MTEPKRAGEILRELGLTTKLPRVAPARDPPRQAELFDTHPVDDFADPVYPDP